MSLSICALERNRHIQRKGDREGVGEREGWGWRRRQTGIQID